MSNDQYDNLAFDAPQPQQAAPAGSALEIALDALGEIALAGMSGTGQESEEGMRDWHARQAWKFIGIAARARDAAKAALAATPPQQAQAPQPVGLTDEQKHDLATNWFAEDWLIDKAIGMLGDYESLNGIPAPQATQQEKTR